MTYTMEMSEECGGRESAVIEAATLDLARAEAEERLDAWVREGEWPGEGADVTARYVLYRNGAEVASEWIEVEIEPDHQRLMRAAGADPECEHSWTSEGEGGCDENPGVWSTGGTSLVVRRHCRHCGLRRTEHITGVQRNPGETDTVTYEMSEE